MSDKHRVPKGRERQLRDRALFHESAAEKSRKVKRKEWKHDNWFNYEPEQLLPYPALLEAAAQSIKVSRIVSGSKSDAEKMRLRLALLKKLSPSHRLVALVVHLREADGSELKTIPTVERCKELFLEKLLALGVDIGQPHSVALKRGGHFDGTHAHAVFPLEALSGSELLALAEAAEVGKGGGALHSSGVHVCIVGDTEKDLDRLASYNSRDGDEALHHEDQDSPQFLAALSRKVDGQLNGVKASPLIWHHPHHLKALKALLPLHVY